ncbi:MAG: gliding motility lipoprotein GldH [Reichenbachiella sp.]
MKNLIHSLLIIFSFSLMMSCGPKIIIDEYKDISTGIWAADSIASFDFIIEDTVINYEIMYNVRYASSYPYYNLFVTYYLEDSVGNILATDLQDLTLFNKKSGEALGEGIGDLYDREIPIFDKFEFTTSGKYSFKVKQFMRMEELPGVISFGLKVIEAEEEED